MASLDDLIASMEVERDAAKNRQRKATAEITLIIDSATKEGRANLTDEEDARVTDLFAQRDLAKSDEAGVNHKLARAQRVRDEEKETAAAARLGHTPGANPPGGARQHEPRAVVTREQRTYSPDTDPYGSQFLRDVARSAVFQDPAAGQRLSSHMHEERVERPQYLERAAANVGTGAFSGLTVPQYLTDMYAPATAALRPFADICNHHPLPADGMSVNISRITTASSVAGQAAEFTEVSSTAMDDTLLTIPVQTAGGQQTISRQALDRGTGIEDVVMQDLFSRYATNLDSTLITQATTGLDASAATITYTDGSPTGPKIYANIIAAMAGVEAAMLAMGHPDTVVMHSRRWYSLASALTSTWPLIGTVGGLGANAGSMETGSTYASGVRGHLPNGTPVVVDNNIATNVGGSQDVIYVVPSRECHLWEEPNAPLFIRAEQPQAVNLGVLFVLYGYFAYTFGRYANAIQKVSGSGLTTPTFTGV
jgi:HK97 family phage major capsid protein